jgi:hypothetical protein
MSYPDPTQSIPNIGPALNIIMLSTLRQVLARIYATKSSKFLVKAV